MLIKGIDFSEQLLRAQGTGDLVVFAGAGVSMPKPALLPSFAQLAAVIGRESNLQRDQHEPEDRYLGRLKKAGVHVHDAAARILVNEATKPTELHRHLLKLFSAGDKVRLVTTNFDTHFSTTAAELYDDKIETFYAPALPLGDQFSGLVYLHGSAEKDPKRCVLTDEDFGSAYLTQAWASRFLAAMFSEYVVLFVGYSHNDTVMNYLARGLPPVKQRARFAFSTSDEESLAKWEFLGIHPMIYEKSHEENAHKAITVSVGEWVSELNRGLLEKAQRIRSVVETQPPLEGEDADYTKYSLAEKSTWQLFFKYARKPEWISWLETQGFSKRIFDWYGSTTEFDNHLALWLTEHFFVGHSSELMAAIQRSNMRIHPQLAWCIWRRLCNRDKEPVGDGFSKWIALLLTQPRQVLEYDDWSFLLYHCRFS
jgi:SIR2-like domain